MRSTWKGSIAFGLVTVPVKLYKATEEKTPSFNQLHATCSARIKYNRVCTKCDREVAFDEIVKGYEYERDCYVVLSDTDLDRGAPEPRVIEITQFVSLSEIDPVQYQTAYYLGPDQIGVKPYALLTEAMRLTERAAIATITLRARERAVLLRLAGSVLVLQTLYWPDEIREPALDFLEAETGLRPQEVEIACSLVQSLAQPYDADTLHDRYRERLEALIQAKVAGVEPEAHEPIETPNVVDLMAALTASVQAAQARSSTEAAS